MVKHEAAFQTMEVAVVDFVPVGSEFLVNTQTVVDQNNPSVAALPNGNFVVTWSANGSALGDSFYPINAQIFSAGGAKIGSEFQVNTQNLNSQGYQTQQVNPRVAALPNNAGFVITWTDYSGTLGDSSGASIKAQLFDLNGARIFGELLVNTNTSGDQLNPAVAVRPQGGGIVVWEDYSGTLGDSSDTSIKAQMVDANGFKLGSEFLVNTYTNSFQYTPTVTGLSNGNFVVTWWDYAGALGDNDSSITAQIIAYDGTKIGGPFPVNSITTGYQYTPSITALSNGGFVVTWLDMGQTQGDSDQGAIKAQVFDASGSKLGGQFLVNTLTAGYQQSPSVAALADGGFVISWATTAGPYFGDGTSEVSAQVFADDGTKIGTEFAVATYNADDQYVPTVAGLANGGFVITWNDESGTLGDDSSNSVKAQVYGIANHIPGNATDEFVVNTQTAGAQFYPETTALSNGNFVVTWRGFSGVAGDPNGVSVNAQIIDGSGNKIGGQLVIDQQGFGPAQLLAIASLTGGGFVVTWEDNAGAQGDGSGLGIVGQIFNANGTSAGDKFQLNIVTGGDQVHPSIVGLKDGTFVATWADNATTDIKFAHFTAAGDYLGGEELVNTYTSGNQRNPVVAALAGGGFVISWDDDSGTLGDNNGVSTKAQIFAANGSKTGGEFLVNTHITAYQLQPTITGLSEGGFVVSWVDYANTLGDSDQSLTAQIFNSAGTKVGGEILVNSLTRNSQFQPAVVAMPGGGFAISWSSYIDETESSDVKAQLFDAVGNKVGEEFRVHDDTLGSQGGSSISSAANGSLLISWEELNSSTNSVDIAARIVNLPSDITGTSGPDILHGTGGADHILGLNGDDQLYGEAGNDTLEGGAGNDRIDGGTGIDTLYGGQGDDRFYVDNAADVVVEYSGQGTDSVYASVSYSIAGQQIEKLYLTGTANITANGNGIANTLVGNSGNNILNGYGGADVMQGGAGDDSYYVDSAGDTIYELADGGIDRVFSTISYSLAGTYVEKLNLTGTANIDATGSGQDNSLVGNSGNNVLNGLTGADMMQGGKGNDSYYVDNAGDKVNELANEGIDTVLSTISFSLGGLQVENLTLRGTEALNGTGNSLANILIGNTGNNTLNGYTGNDELHGGKGSDVLIGGAGQDRFVFDTAVGGDIDTLSDFSAVDDQIGLARSIFTALAPGGTLAAGAFRAGTAALDADDRIIYDAAAGKLYYDADGNGAGGMIQFARLTAHSALTAADFFII